VAAFPHLYYHLVRRCSAMSSTTTFAHYGSLSPPPKFEYMMDYIEADVLPETGSR
jgi:hypothetical protein